MEDQNKIVTLLSEIKTLLAHQKRTMNVKELVAYTGLSSSKIYKLTSLKLIPTSNNPYLRQKFFDKEEIDKWLMGNPNLSDEYLEEQLERQLYENSKKSRS